MAFQTNPNDQGYGGFFNGYMAGNLIANSGELSVHRERISFFLDELRKEISRLEIAVDSRQAFNLALDPINVLVQANTASYYYELGQKLLSVFDFISSLRSIGIQIPTTTNFLLRKIIYHYLNIAEKAKDASVTQIAEDIVAQFERK